MAREDEIAKQAGLTFDLQFHKPSHDSIEAKAAHLRGLTIAVKSPDGATSKINSWTSGNWPEWEEPKKTYALNDGRELAEGEEFEPDSVSVHVWRKENRQAWNKGQTVAWNYEQREEYALRQLAVMDVGGNGAELGNLNRHRRRHHCRRSGRIGSRGRGLRRADCPVEGHGGLSQDRAGLAQGIPASAGRCRMEGMSMAYGYVVITAFMDMGTWYDNVKVDGRHPTLQHVIDLVD